MRWVLWYHSTNVDITLALTLLLFFPGCVGRGVDIVQVWIYLCRLMSAYQDSAGSSIAMYLFYPPYNQARALLPRTCLGPTIHYKRKD